jgi:4-carboxymuconolactone decarboxylase
MTRISLIDENATPDIAALSAKIRGARGGTLHAFYRALMHAPGLASAWFDFNNAVRFGNGLDERTRELVILRVAAITGCEFVRAVHEAKYAAPAGVEPGEIAALRAPKKTTGFSPRDQALLDYVDAMTRDVAVPDAVFDALRPHFPEREIMELTVVVCGYNMHTRLVMALDIQPENK